jgi:hemerythrin
MALFDWQQRFLIGITEIDEHHIHLVGLLNTAYDDFRRAATVERLNTLFFELIDYATYHFAAEERLMKNSGYPSSEAHVRQHQQFAVRVTEMHRDYLAGKPVYLEILTFLKGWLEAHILETDGALGRFLKETDK